MKRWIAAVLLLVLLFCCIPFPVFAGEDNASSGSGDIYQAADGYAWYRSSERLWKVTLYAGTADTVTTSSSLTEDFYSLGTLLVKSTGWSFPSGTQFGSCCKAEYLTGNALQSASSVLVLEVANCPAVPVVGKGNLETVKSFFGSTGTMLTLLDTLASAQGTTAAAMLQSYVFSIGGIRKAGWDSSWLLPDGIQNRIPWVIVYEPMAVLRLKDGTTRLAWTATECAIASICGWYDWFYSHGNGQCIANLTNRNLPTSVQLEYSWFGYPVYVVTGGTTYWEDEDIFAGGGWGMRWLNAAVTEQIAPDLSTTVLSVSEASAGQYGSVRVRWQNLQMEPQTVVCELYLGTRRIWSDTKTIAGNSSVIGSYAVYYPSSGYQTLTSKINWEHRNEESDASNNRSLQTVYVEKERSPSEEYSCTIAAETPYAGGSAAVTVHWQHSAGVETGVLCELYAGDTLLLSETKTIPVGNEICSVYQISYPTSDAVTLEARIHYEERFTETDPYDNAAATIVVPRIPEGTSYDFAVSDGKAVPDTVAEGETCQIHFTVWNLDSIRSYSGIPVELFLDGAPVDLFSDDFLPGESRTYTVELPMVNAGRKVLTVRVNWEDRTKELDPNNNEEEIRITVQTGTDLRIEAVTPNAFYTSGTEVITSFVIGNDGPLDVVPDSGNLVTFTVTANGAVLETQQWEQAVVPALGENLAWFRWTVPENLAECTVTCTAVVNALETVPESTRANNMAMLEWTVIAKKESQTPDTVYERKAPDGFTVPDLPETENSSVTWGQWTYENGTFQFHTYGICLDLRNITGESGSNANWYWGDDGIRVTRSGYGVTVFAFPSVDACSGTESPEDSSVTGAQQVLAYFPEFQYGTESGRFRSLELVNGLWQFTANPYSDSGQRVHFLPVWYPDGIYGISVVATDCWTPAGCVTSAGLLELRVEGSVYDDWYLGR